MTVRRLLSGELRLGLAVFGLAAVLVFVLAGCSDSKPDNKSGGTPFCVTIDFDTLEDQAVTIRERDSMGQQRIALDQVEGWLAQRLVGC